MHHESPGCIELERCEPEISRPPLWTALRGGIENFQLDRSCALLLLAGASMAAFGVLAALVVGAVRDVDVIWVVATFVGLAALSALVGGWIWRRSRRLGVRPLGLRILAVLILLLAVPFGTLRLIDSWRDGSWRAVGDLLAVGVWIVQSVWFWRLGGGPRASGETLAATEGASAPR